MHLEPAALVDIADGTRAESSIPHLASCAACRQQLADLRATLTSVAAVDVPEPSPLFWDHLSRRVRDAVAAEDRRGGSWWTGLAARGIVAATVLAGVLAIVLVPGLLRSKRGQETTTVAPSAAAAPVLRDTLADVMDPSLSIVAGLTDGINWEDAHDAGLAPRGSAEHAVTHLNDAELRELQRLLKVELAHATD